MQNALAPVDWVIIGTYCVAMAAIGALLKSRAESNTSEFFLSGRNLPWWLAGTSMAATTFSIDTPLYVTELVRKGGIQANWQWWAIAFAHVLAIFVFARLWRRAEVMTEAELSELRYSGRGAAVLRGVKAFWFAVPFNCLLMGGLSMLAFVAVCRAVTDLNPYWSLGIAVALTLLYTSLSGLWGVVVTDLIQFVIAMTGAVVLAIYAVHDPRVGGLAGLREHLAQAQRAGEPVLGLVPSFSTGGGAFLKSPLAEFLCYVLVMWWAFKNADGGGIIIQRMSAARNERHALLGTLWFNLAHYAFRTWPWILAALATLVLYPHAVPGFENDASSDKMAYARLVTDLLPAGLRGLMLATFLAAFMATVSTQLNWGASYLANDLYRRFIDPRASERTLITMSRVAMVILLAMSAWICLLSSSLVGTFKLILTAQMGTGLVYILRWYWWRLNAWAELASILVSSLATLLLVVAKPLGAQPSFAETTLFVCGVTLFSVLVVTLLTAPVRREQLLFFYRRVRPNGPGWGPIARLAPEVTPPATLASDVGCWLLGVLGVLGLTVSIGWTLLHDPVVGGAGCAGSLVMMGLTVRAALSRRGSPAPAEAAPAAR